MKILQSVTIAALLLSAFTFANYTARRGIYITQPEEEGQEEVSGIVYGVHHCGGHGKVVQWRVEGCTPEETCKYPADEKRRPTELEFIPSEDIGSLGIRAILIYDGMSRNIYEQAIAGSEVQGGERYVVHASVALQEEMRGKLVTAQYILYRVDDNEVEICAEANFDIV